MLSIPIVPNCNKMPYLARKEKIEITSLRKLFSFLYFSPVYRQYRFLNDCCHLFLSYHTIHHFISDENLHFGRFLLFKKNFKLPSFSAFTQFAYMYSTKSKKIITFLKTFSALFLFLFYCVAKNPTYFPPAPSSITEISVVFTAPSLSTMHTKFKIFKSLESFYYLVTL